MYKESDFKKGFYTTGEVAKFFGVTSKTMQNWDTSGKIKFTRSDTNRRMISKEELLKCLEERDMLIRDIEEMADIIYVAGRKTEDLSDRVLKIVGGEVKLKNVLVIQDIKEEGWVREGIMQILQRVMDGKVLNIYTDDKPDFEYEVGRYWIEILKLKNIKVL